MQYPLVALKVFCAAGLLIAAGGNAHAQPSNSFSPAGEMTASRISHSAVLLQDGRVLIAGGADASLRCTPKVIGSILASAEIFDPASGSFSQTSDMITPRMNFAAVRLLDGRVLLAGGYNSVCTNAPVGNGNAELYDPATNTFQPTGRMINAQGEFSAVLLGNGKVLIAGGDLVGTYGGYSAPAELYDPAAGSFQLAGWSANLGATLTVLSDGKVLVAGGYLANFARIYDPESNTIAPSGTLVNFPYGVYWNTATWLGNGQVLLAGGADDDDGQDLLAKTNLYDPVTGRFFPGTPMHSVRASHTATLLPGGNVLLAGGGPVTAELYDPISGKFANAANMLIERRDHTATLLADGRVLITGGWDGTAVTGSSEFYTPANRAISAARFTSPLAQDSVATLVGSQLAGSTIAADTHALPTKLAGVSMRITDSAGQVALAPLLYVSPSQINFQIPAGTAEGDAVFQVVNAPLAVVPAQSAVRSVAPGLFTWANNYAVAYGVRLEPDGKEIVLSPGTPITLDDRPVALVIYATGVRNRSALTNVRATIGNVSVPVFYAGEAGDGIPGLDQVNVYLTADLKGNTDGRLVLVVDGLASNTVLVDVH